MNNLLTILNKITCNALKYNNKNFTWFDVIKMFN